MNSPGKLAIIVAGQYLGSLCGDCKNIKNGVVGDAAMQNIAALVGEGYRLVILHESTPFLGMNMLWLELARVSLGLRHMPLDSCQAAAQGCVGYLLQQYLQNIFIDKGISSDVVSVVTQMRVDADDPSFSYPSRFVGEFYTEDQLPELQAMYPDWTLCQDGSLGWRRLVATPMPKEIIEVAVLEHLLAQGCTLLGLGGGGIPVIRTVDGRLSGVEALLPVAASASFLGCALGADLLFIPISEKSLSLSGGVQHDILGSVSLAQLEEYVEEGRFEKKEIRHKVLAAIDFLHGGGKEVIFASPESLYEAFEDGAGTHVYREHAEVGAIGSS